MMFLLILIFLEPLFKSGHIVFSDLDFPKEAQSYMDQIFGLWNGRWSSATMFNLPRLLYISIPYLISSLFAFNGEILLKVFLVFIIFNSALSIYILSENIIAVYFKEKFDFYRVFILVTAGLFYALNPWVIFRIQHIYLLCGYSLFPMVINYFLYIFHPKFIIYRNPDDYIFGKKLIKQNYRDIAILCFLISMSAGAIHYFFYIFIYLGIIFTLIMLKYPLYFLIKYGKNKAKRYIISNIKKIVIAAVFFTLFNFYWLSIYFGNIFLGLEVSQHNINLIDTLVMFSKNSSPLKVVYLISYWWPMFNLNSLPMSFYIGGGVILFFVIAGVFFRFTKDNIVVWFTLTSLIFILMSTGVELSHFAESFVNITKLPLFGNIFRDPNKTIGILALNYSILLIFGLEHIYNYIKDTAKGKALKLMIMSIIILGFTYYIKPFRDHFIEGFFFPVEIPKEYTELNENLNKNDKVLYMPNAENMLRNVEGTASPFWNKNPYSQGIAKSTADFHIYNSKSDTIFHHEGNTLSITYYLNFLQHLLDNGITKDFRFYLEPLGINKYIYHNEYTEQEERQEFNEKILDLQDNMNLSYENDIFKTYELDKRDIIRPIYKKILTPYSYTHLAGYREMNNFNLKDYGVLYSTLSFDDSLELMEKNDYIEVVEKNDLMLSTLDEKYYIKPFDYINDGNVFLRWSKTFLKNSDWQWFMRINEIDNFKFEHDFGKGVAVTFSGAGLKVPAYKEDELKGRVILDFDSILKLDKFFIADNPDIFEVYANPLSAYSKFPVILGEIAKDYPRRLWQVAKSELLPIRENMFYRFNLKLSGRGTNKMHFKVRFYDVHMDELSISYIVAPSEEVNFNGIDFFGEAISPKESKYMRIDLLSYQRPSQKVYWWIHDIKIHEYEGETERNIVNMTKSFDTNEEVNLYARVFFSRKGGEIKFIIDKKEYSIDTYNKYRNEFRWIKIDKINFRKGENRIELENITGFNAVNILAYIPGRQMNHINNKLRKVTNSSKLFFALEAEQDFDYKDFDAKGSVQSERQYPYFNNGRGISLNSGELEREFDILKTAEYSMLLRFNNNQYENGSAAVEIINKNNETVYKNRFGIYNDSPEQIRNTVIDSNYFKTFIREYKEIDNQVKNIKEIELNNINLKQGKYTLKVKLNSNVASQSNIFDLKKFDPSRIKDSYEFSSKKKNQDGCDCIRITDDMYSHYVRNNTFYAKFDKTCSSDWYEYGSNTIWVSEENEYLFTADIVSDGGRNRHIKLEMLDRNDRVIKAMQIADVAEEDKNKWNHYETIVRIPKGVKKVIVKFSIKGEEERNGTMKIKNFQFIKYSNLITFDNIVLFEGDNKKEFFNIDKYYQIKNINRLSEMNTEFDLHTYSDNKSNKNKILLNYMESYHPIWQIKSIKNQRPYIINGLTNSYLIESDTDDIKVKYSIKTVMKDLYYLGLFFLILAFCLLIYLFTKDNS